MLVTLGTIAVAAIVKLLFLTNLMQRLNFVAIDHLAYSNLGTRFVTTIMVLEAMHVPVLGFRQTTLSCCKNTVQHLV